jgi:PadR family transcriptional regulator, regulatory protein PadR
MGKEDYLGEFEQVVLLAVLRLGEGAYGMTIRREIEERAGRKTSIGAVYATLDRLEEKGYVTSERGEPTPERGGRAKRYFRVMPSGMYALERSRELLVRMWAGLRPVPGTAV